MFEAFGIEPSASRLDLYLEVLGTVDADTLHDAVIDALREGGDFPPSPGALRKHVDANRRARPSTAPRISAKAGGPSPNEQRVLRELHRRLSERPRSTELKPFQAYLDERRVIEEQLAADLIALSRSER